MAHQGLGQFAGSFADSFAETFGQINDNKRRDELAKLQAKLVEAQLKAGEIKLNAQTTLADLMTGSVGEIETLNDTSQVDASGRRQAPDFDFTGKEPMGLSEILSDPEGQLAALQSGSLNISDMLDFQTDQRRLDSMPDMNQFLGTLVPDEKGNAPFVMSGGTFDPSRGFSPTIVRNPEFNTSQEDAFSASSLSQLTKSATEAIDIERELSGSLLESGFPFGGEARTGQSAFATIAGGLGFDTSEQRASVANRDRVEKLYGQILGIRMQRMSDSGESITNDKLAFLQSVSPGTEKSSDANAKLLADFLQEEINRADIEGTAISPAERKKVLEFIRQARSGEFFQNENEPVIDVPAIMKMTLEQIESLDIESMTLEQTQAIRERISSLK